MIDDPIVQDIREIRQRLWEECGGDLDRYLAMIKAAGSKYADRQVTKEEVEDRSRAAIAAAKEA